MIESFGVGTKLDGDAAKITVSTEPSPTPLNRYALGHGQPTGSATTWEPRSATPPAQSPKSPSHISCPGRPRTGRSSPTPSLDRPNPPRCVHSASMRRGAVSLDGAVRRHRKMGASRPVGHRIRRLGRQSRDTRANRRPHHQDVGAAGILMLRLAGTHAGFSPSHSVRSSAWVRASAAPSAR